MADMEQAAGTGQPIAENEPVQEMLALLKENNPAGYQEFSRLIESVSLMESRLAVAVGELEAMRGELQKMQNHSLKAALQNTCKSMEANISSMQQRLAEVKEKIVEGCKNVLADFKERGTVALNGIAHFLHLKPALEAIRQSAEYNQKETSRSMAKIDAFVSEYHEAGKHLKNMRLALMGKEPEQEARSAGRIAACVKAPYRASRACMGALGKGAVKAMDALERLEQAAELRPSVLKTMREQTAKAEPVKERQMPSRDKGSR